MVINEAILNGGHVINRAINLNSFIQINSRFSQINEYQTGVDLTIFLIIYVKHLV